MVLVVMVSSAITFVVVYRGTGTQLRRQVDQELAGDFGELSNLLAGSRSRSPRALAALAQAYIRNQPFSASSTLLFVRLPGAPTSTNRPELFGSGGPDNGENAREQARENRLARQLIATRDGYSTIILPDIGNLRLLERGVHTAGGLRATVGVGEPLAGVTHAQQGVARTFILAGLLALAGALAASLLIGARLSLPLRRMATVAAQVDAGDLHPRIHDVDRASSEIQVLAESFNHMLDRLTEAFSAQRAFVADASHELRTPLTVIRGQLDLLASQEHPSDAEIQRVEHMVQVEIARISRLVDDLLLLARSDSAQFLHRRPIEVPMFVNELWNGLAALQQDRALELAELSAGTLYADPDRLAQALRNLLLNAIQHTPADRGVVRLEVQPAGGWLRFAIHDNGPGIPLDQRERIFDRFHRIDAARDRATGGTGLGLAIVRAIAQAHGGRVRASSSPLGGAQIELELPGYTAGRSVRAEPDEATPATGGTR